MDFTSRASLPFLSPGQVQKEWLHNEALALVDLLIGGTIEPALSAAPPATPVAASWYRVDSGATGEWFGRGGQIAAFGSAGWRFVAPFAGLRLVERASGIEWIFRAGAWEAGKARAAEYLVDGVKVVGPRASAIAAPAGGATVDGESRGAISAILAALRAHGLIAT